MRFLKIGRQRQRQANKVNRFRPIVKIVCVGVLCVFGQILTDESFADEKAAESPVKCDIHAGACSQNLEDLQITLDISPKPVEAMRDLLFKVKLTGQTLQTPPYIDLEMPGMKMGPNRIKLESTSGMVYEGKGVIVRCPSGDRTWHAIVTVPGKGKADFIFDVIY